MKKNKLLIFSILLIGLAYFVFVKVDRFLEIDKCLDKGSKWNYSENKCECLNKTEIDQKNKIFRSERSEERRVGKEC